VVQTLSDNSAMRSLCSISGFVNDIMFSHNGPMGQNQVRRYVFSSSPGGGTGDDWTKYDVVLLRI